MGFLSFLFPPNVPPEPSSEAPRLALRSVAPWTSLPPHDYTVIDTETTGLNACTCEILEIAAIRCRNHREVDRFRTYIRPEGRIPQAASDVNHITWNKVYQAPFLHDVIDNFFAFIGDDVLVGYNLGFDLKFIQTRTQIDVKNDSFDVLPFVKRVFPGLLSYKLDYLRQRYSLGGRAHSAIGDCTATSALLRKCLSMPAGKDIEAVAQEEAQRRAAERAKIEQEREEIKIKRGTLKSSDPPKSTQKHLSQSMAGSNHDYIDAVRNILKSCGRDIENLRYQSSPTSSGYQDLSYVDVPFAGVKTTGTLRYFVLNLPKDQLSSNFPCALASLSEGTFATRLFVTTPDDLRQLKEYILRCFDTAAKDHQAVPPPLPGNPTTWRR